MSEAERKSVLELFPYFNQKYPVVVDVGSNKGEWSDLLIDRVAEMHLFEPNELLLHYTMVKYCDRDNVYYNADAVSDKISTVEFSYFVNENNGLSNIFGNPKWDYLPYKRETIDTTTLDSYWFKDFDIDFLKIDVEGAEMLVLKGAADLLSKRRIKFIQVEKAEHILLSGYTFENLTAYLKAFGYRAIETEDTENVIFAMEGFTQDWNGEFKKNTKGMKFGFALEIGCFEGLTSTYICDHLLNPEGRMICVDPLTDEYLPGHEDNNLFVGQYERFVRNTKGKPIELIRKKSIDAYHELRDYRFDFIYIDGDHRENEVYLDAVNCFTLLKVGGHMLFDDYEWREETKRGIDRFLNSLPTNKMTIEHKGYQVMIKKHENLD